MLPFADSGDKASNPAVLLVAPVPPFVIGTAEEKFAGSTARLEASTLMTPPAVTDKPEPTCTAPNAEAVAALIETTGVVVPVTTIGEVPDMLVTPLEGALIHCKPPAVEERIWPAVPRAMRMLLVPS